MPSPSWPVSVTLPRPGMRVASVVRISPPVSVHARPVATPTSGVRSASRCGWDFGAPGRRARRLGREDLPSGLRPRETRGHADLRRALGFALRVVLRDAEELDDPR